MFVDRLTERRIQVNWYTLCAVLFVIFLELGWVVPWYEILVGAAAGVSQWSAILVIGGLMTAAYVAALMVEVLNLIRSVRLVVQVGVLIAGLTLSMAIFYDQSSLEFITDLFNLELVAVLSFMILLWVWWRGITLAQTGVHPHIVWQRFRLGLIMLFFYSASINWIRDEVPELGWFIFFLFFGFLALVLSRVALILDSRSGKNPFDVRWLTGIILFITVLLAVAATLSSLLTGQFSMVLDLLSGGIRLIVSAFLFLAALPGILIISLLEPWIASLQSRLGETILPTLEPVEQPYPEIQPAVPAELTGIWAWLPYIQSAIIWTIIILLLVWVFWRLSRFTRRSSKMDGSEPESLIEPGNAGKLLRRAFQKTIDDLFSRLRREPRTLPDEKIRRIYIRLLELFDDLNLPRPSPRTPLEYLPVMQSRLPAVKDELTTITEAYVSVRYSQSSESSKQVKSVEEAWERVARVGKQDSRTRSVSSKDE